jgi:hypothetical protein
MVILWISLVLDAVLMIFTAVKTKNISHLFRFCAFAAVINLLAYCVAYGLNESFDKNISFDIICTAAAKIFVYYVFIIFGQNKNPRGSAVYLMAAAVSLCAYAAPLVGIICGVILLIYLLYAEYSDKDEAKNNSLPPSNENSLYLRTIEENYRKSRALWHDLNNHILSMRSLAETRQYGELEIYINSLSEKIAGSVFPIKSGNIVLDAIVADKYQRANRAGIYVEFESVNYKNAINDEDLCAVIGNLFDNSIEENLRSVDKGGRYIKLHIASIDDWLVIRLKNPLNQELAVKSGLPSTTKPDAVHHGMGLKNVRQICDKYNGELVWTDENGIFEIAARLIVTSNTSVLTSAKNTANYMV